MMRWLETQGANLMKINRTEGKTSATQCCFVNNSYLFVCMPFTWIKTNKRNKISVKK